MITFESPRFEDLQWAQPLLAAKAGREVRIMVNPEAIPEDKMVLLAREIAKKIEDELEYPGQIKVNLIRETKAIEYAK